MEGFPTSPSHKNVTPCKSWNAHIKKLTKEYEMKISPLALLVLVPTLGIAADDYTVLDYVRAGETRVGTTVNTDTRLQMLDDSTVVDTTVLGKLQNAGAIDTGTQVMSGGVLMLVTGEDTGNPAVSNNATINQGGVAQLYDKATANDWVINGGFVGIQRADAVANNTEVNGGSLVVYSGTANQTTVTAGKLLNLGGTDVGTVVSDAGNITLQGAGSTAYSSGTIITAGGNAVIKGDSIGEDWTINGTRDDYVTLESDTAVLNNSTLNSGNVVVNRGTVNALTSNGGDVMNYGGVTNGVTMVDGTFYQTGDLTPSSSDLTVGEAALAHIQSGTLHGAVVDGRLNIVPNGFDTGVTTTLSGAVAIGATGELAISAGVITDDTQITNAGNILLRVNSWETGQYGFSLGDLVQSGGVVSFDPVGYSTLTLGTLSGSGVFNMNTSIADGVGDLVVVTGSATGNHGILVQDQGTSPTTASSLYLVRTADQPATFSLTNVGQAVDLGTYQYMLVADGKGGWLLAPKVEPQPDPVDPVVPDEPISPVEPSKPETPTVPDVPAIDPVVPRGQPVITPSAAALLAAATVDPILSKHGFDITNARLAALNTVDHASAFWATADSARYNVNAAAGANYWMQLSSVTLGLDTAVSDDSGNLVYGGYFGVTHGDVHFTGRGNGGMDVNAYLSGLYGNYLSTTGYFVDGTVQLSYMTHDIDTHMTSGTAVNGSHNSYGIAANVKGGKHIPVGPVTVSPYVSMTGFTNSSRTVNLDNNMTGRFAATQSLLPGVGIRVGSAVNVGNTTVKPYVDVVVEHELVNNNTVHINNDKFTNDLSGTRVTYRTGVDMAVTTDFSVQIGVQGSQGNHIDSPWAATIGGRWTF